MIGLNVFTTYLELRALLMVKNMFKCQDFDLVMLETNSESVTISLIQKE